MRKQKLTGILLWLLTIVVQGQVDQSPLTFENALQLVHNNNPQLKRMESEIKQKQFEKSVKKGLFMPKVSVSAKAVSMSDPLHLDLTDIRDAILPIYDVLGNYGVFSGVPNPDPATNTVLPILPDDLSTAGVRQNLVHGGEEVANGEWDQMIQEKNFATVTADFIWPVFTGGKIAGANKAAGVEMQISEQENSKAEGELLTELVTRYYGLVLAMQAEKVMKEKFDAMTKHYTDAQKRFDEGVIAKVELLNASVAKSDAEREYKSAQRMVNTVKAGLDVTLAQDSIGDYVPVNLLFVNKDIPNLDFWINTTFESNPQLKQIEFKRELVDIKSTVSKGNYLPTVAILGTYNLADYKLSPYTPHWMVGAGVKWTIFEGMSRNKQIKADQSLSNQVMYVEEKAHDDLTAYLTKLYNQLNDELFKIEELKNTLELATEYCNSTEKAFSEGFVNSTSVVEAQSKLAQVKALRLKSFYQYDVTLAALLQISGTPDSYINYCNGENTIVESIK